MLRMLLIVTGLAFAQPAISQDTNAPVIEQSLEMQIWDTLQMSELAWIIRDEALVEAEDMQKSMFERGGDGRWLDAVEKIHTPKRVEKLLRDNLTVALKEVPEPLIQEGLRFYETDLGRKIVLLEDSTRRAMLDEDVEEDAFAGFAEAASHNKPRVAQIGRMIEEADLIEQNVVSGLNSVLAFSKGFEAGDGYRMPMTEAQILEETWKQEPLIRSQSLGWLEAFLYLAYSSLSDEELDEYIEFSRSLPGKALTNVLYSSFDKLFVQTSYEMGIAAAGQLEGRAL